MRYSPYQYIEYLFTPPWIGSETPEAPPVNGSQ
jgi:hypothetical protein